MLIKICVLNVVILILIIWTVWGNTALMVDVVMISSRCIILLSHRPELFETYAACGVDLVLSGHAYGGHFRLPFIGGLVALNQGLFSKYDAGLYTNGGTNMVVSRGIGNSTVPFRFNNRPEIVLVELNAE